jgi:hypothetical protein
VVTPFFGESAPTTADNQNTVVILHALAVLVEQLCARSADAPPLEKLRPNHCPNPKCGAPARDGKGGLQLVGHGLYLRHVRGLTAVGWIEIWIRRFLCRVCGHTMSVLPDWLHPWRWYAAPVIIEALYRHCVLGETACSIGVRFGRSAESTEWRSLRRWRAQLLVSPTLWGWLGPRLGVIKPAGDRQAGAVHLVRLLADAGQLALSGVQAVREISGTARRTLSNLIHNREKAWLMEHFPPGAKTDHSPEPTRPVLPTEKASGPRAP